MTHIIMPPRIPEMKIEEIARLARAKKTDETDKEIKNGNEGERKDESVQAQSVPVIPRTFQEYYGRNVDKAPEILTAGKIIAPFFYIAQKRIASTTPEEVAQFVDNYYDTSDLIAYASQRNNNEVKVVMSYDNQFKLTSSGKFCLNLINPNETLVNGAVNLSNRRYEQIKGKGVIVMKKKELAEVLDTEMLKQKALDSRLWRILLRHQDEVESEFAVPDLHENYIDLVYKAYKNRFEKTAKFDDLKLMGVYPDSAGDIPKLRAWCVYRLVSGSGAGGRRDLDDDDGRFLGLAPEAPNAPGRRT